MRDNNDESHLSREEVEITVEKNARHLPFHGNRTQFESVRAETHREWTNSNGAPRASPWYHSTAPVGRHPGQKTAHSSSRLVSRGVSCCRDKLKREGEVFS